MCTLHNLCYRLDTEVPTRYRQLEHNARNAYTEKSSTGCFSSKNGRMMVSVCVCPCVCPSAPAESPGSHCLVPPASLPCWSPRPVPGNGPLPDLGILRHWGGVCSGCRSCSDPRRPKAPDTSLQACVSCCVTSKVSPSSSHP